MKIYIFLVLCMLVISRTLHAQTPMSSSLLVKGFTLQKDSLSTASFVTVTNKRSLFRTISAENGYFALYAQRGDTLEFSAVNLEPSFFVVPTYYVSHQLAVRVILQTKTYQLNEIVVRPYTEKQFKKDVLALQLPENEPDIQLPKIPKLATPSGVAQNGTGIGIAVSGPLTKLYDAFSKEGKSKRKLVKMMATDSRKKMYAAKMNREFISRITGLDDKVLEEFMNYCKLDEDFVIGADEYELVLAINECLKSFHTGRN